LRLIAAQESLEATPAPTANGMHRVLDLLRRRFNYVVIDLPMPATPAEMQALRDARHLLAVMTPDLVSIRDVNRLRQMATGLGINRTVVVLNRLGMPGGLTLPLIETASTANRSSRSPISASNWGGRQIWASPL